MKYCTIKAVPPLEYDRNQENAQVLMAYGNRNELKNVYTYGNQRLTDENVDTGITNTFLYNGQGSVAQIANISGTIVQEYRYEPFGEMTQGEPKQDLLFGYNGEEYNPITGMQYLRARYYNVEVGRFIARDDYLGETNEPNTLNRYVYVANDPINYTDPSGRASIDDSGNKSTSTMYSTKEVQKKLKSLGYCGADDNVLTIDGKNGNNTEYAIRCFQIINSLQIDGIVGKNTWGKLFGSPMKYSQKALYEKIQGRLNNLGYYGSDGNKLTITGTINENTKYAVKLFQAANSLKVDGILGANTQKKLFSSGARPFFGERPKPKLTNEERMIRAIKNYAKVYRFVQDHVKSNEWPNKKMSMWIFEKGGAMKSNKELADWLDKNEKTVSKTLYSRIKTTAFNKKKRSAAILGYDYTSGFTFAGAAKWIVQTAAVVQFCYEEVYNSVAGDIVRTFYGAKSGSKVKDWDAFRKKYSKKYSNKQLVNAYKGHKALIESINKAKDIQIDWVLGYD